MVAPDPSTAPDRHRRGYARKAVYWLTYVFVTLGLAVVGVEIGLRLLAPVGIMHPRYRADPTYGHANWSNARIVQSKPGGYAFQLTTNDLGYRGPMPEPEDTSGRKVVALLGDSYTFGSGVNDGDEFAAVMRRRIGNDYTILNFGVGSYSLAHQIKQYHREVRGFAPDLIVLQFSENDVSDNVFEPVTVPGHAPDAFEFQELHRNDGGLKSYLSRSRIQHSQLYNHLRRLAFSLEQEASPIEDRSHTAQQRLYVDLLHRFLTLLARDEVAVVFIAVEDSLDSHPLVREAVAAADEANRLHFLDTSEWLDGLDGYASPEGHLWGAPAHAIIGQRLSDAVSRLLAKR